VEFKPNEHIKVTRNPDYWKPARPYLDAIEYTIIKNASTAILAFVSGKVDMTFPYSVTQPLLNDVKGRMPHALCETSSLGLDRSLSRTHRPRGPDIGGGQGVSQGMGGVVGPQAAIVGRGTFGVFSILIIQEVNDFVEHRLGDGKARTEYRSC